MGFFCARNADLQSATHEFITQKCLSSIADYKSAFLDFYSKKSTTDYWLVFGSGLSALGKELLLESGVDSVVYDGCEVAQACGKTRFWVPHVKERASLPFANDGA